MNLAGNFALILAWTAALIGILAGCYGGYVGDRRYTYVAIRATRVVFFASTVSIFALGYAFYTNDYTNQYVWQYSNKDMPAIYRVSAIWGGMDGSMLLWCFFHAISAGLVTIGAKKYPHSISPWMFAVLNGSLLFFMTIALFLTNPFRFIEAPFIPPDGNGLNPLLQNPYMAIHPPMLYLGFTTLAVPYAFCLGALAGNNTSYEWIKLTRRWTLMAWAFLTVGITLGGYWAYIELGWGGFWAWDPVENASFMPWLTATAFLHSVMVQERKGMLKAWNIWLIVMSYLLTVFGTFLTRSGIVQSVHAFASTDVGEVFLIYIGIIFCITLGLTIYRREALAAPRKIESFLSREAAFLVNNLIFLSILFATFWGVMFPIFSEALTGEKQAVGIPFFNTVNVPLFLLMLFLMGIGPLIAWRKATLKNLRKSFLMPFVIGLIGGLLLIWAGISDFWAVTSYALCLFVFMTMLGESYRALKAQKASEPEQSISTGITQVWRRQQRRYAGFLVHVGVLIATIGITASMAHKIEREFALGPGEIFSVGRYDLQLQDVNNRKTPNYEALYSKVRAVERSTGKEVAILKPELRFYKKSSETTTEVALKKGIREDLYIVLAGLNDSQTKATFKVYVNPLQGLLWLGVFIMAFGSVVLVLSSPKTMASEELSYG